MDSAIVAQAWIMYPEDRAARMVAMTARGMRASEARLYAAEGPCGRGQNPKRDGCTAGKKKAGKKAGGEKAKPAAKKPAGAPPFDRKRGTKTTPKDRENAARDAFRR